jgi:hypothetical protein
MIVVKVELHSAITGQKSELARMVIDNIGGTAQLGDYNVRTMRGRDEEALERSMWGVLKGQAKPTRESKVLGHPRLREHVWHLVGKALHALEYGGPK